MSAFCEDCGHATTPKPTGKFNRDNGKPVMRDACTNDRCLRGCLTNHGRHDYGKTIFGNLRTEGTCSRCGHTYDLSGW